MRARLVISPDEKWIVAARTDGGNSWARPNSVYRVNVETGGVHRIEFPPAATGKIEAIENYDSIEFTVFAWFCWRFAGC